MWARRRHAMASQNVVWLFILLSFPMLIFDSMVSSDQISDDELASLLELIEFDYEDTCISRAEFEWSIADKKPINIEEKLDAEKSYGYFARMQVAEVKESQTENPVLLRKLELISKPGDPMLETDQWNKLVSYSGYAEYGLQTTNDIDCKRNASMNCTLAEYLKVMSTSRNTHLLASAKNSWLTILPDEKKYFAEILPLLKNASINNGQNNVKQYWEMLVEYDDAYHKAKQLWEEIEPHYMQLQKYVAMRLEKHNYTVNADDSIPSHFLGSQFGEDWINIADIVLPYPAIYRKIKHNLETKQIGGRTVFKLASNALHKIKLGELNEKFWRESRFDKDCPMKLINFCRSDGIKVSTCKDNSFPQLLDAHEAAMAVKHAYVKSQKIHNSYLLREANRFSALNEGLNGLGSLIALMIQQKSDGVLLLNQNPSKKQQNEEQITLQFLLALRDFPRLSYYFAADKWRLNLIENPESFKTWEQFRRNLASVSSTEKEFLGDSYFLKNKPYIAKYFGIFLKYQIYEHFTKDMFGDSEDPVMMMAQKSHEIQKMMEKGFNEKWPVILSEETEINDISADSIINYFQPLMEFLTTEVAGTKPDEKSSSGIMNYDENNEADVDKDEYVSTDDLNEDIDQNEIKKQHEPEVVTEKMLHDNKLYENELWPGREESTTNFQNNPNLIPKDYDGGSPAASSSNLSNVENNNNEVTDSASLQYAWIALGVLALIVLVLAITIIARKRYKHKKELERERRQGSA